MRETPYRSDSEGCDASGREIGAAAPDAAFDVAPELFGAAATAGRRRFADDTAQ